MTTMTASGTSVAGLCQSVRRNLSQNLNDELVVTLSEYTPASGTISFATTNRRVGPGTLLSWREATLYVTAVGTGSDTADVISGYDGGSDVIIPAGTPLRINPRFTDYTIFVAVSDAMREMVSPVNGLYFPCTYTFPGGEGFLPIGDNIKRVTEVRARAGTDDWVRLGPSEFTVSLDPQNTHVRVFVSAQEYQVVCAAGFVMPTSFDDDVVDDCFLLPSMVDIPVLGASATLMYGQEARRVQQRAQGDPRRAEDVPMTGAASAGRDMRRMFQQRIDEEHAKLIAQTSYRIG